VSRNANVTFDEQDWKGASGLYKKVRPSWTGWVSLAEKNALEAWTAGNDSRFLGTITFAVQAD